MTLLERTLQGAGRVRASVMLDGSEWGSGDPRHATTRNGGGSGGSIRLVGNKSATYEMLYRTQPWVRATIDRVANGIGRLPLDAYVDGEHAGQRTKQRTGSLAELLAEPFEGGTPSMLKQAIVKNLMLHENCVLVPVSPGIGRPPTELIPSSFAYWDVITGSNGRRIDWYVFHGEIAGKPQRFAFRPEEVIHFGFWGTAKGLGQVGDPRMESLRRTLMIEDATQRAIIAAFENGPRPMGAYSIDGTLKDKAAAERMRAQLDEAYGSVDNAFKVMILEGGAKWQDMSHNFVDSDLVNLRKLTREEVVAVFNLPQPSAGILDHATFSNIVEQHLMEYQDTYQPYTTTIEETLQVQLINRQPTMAGQYVEFNFKEVMKGDPVKEIEAGVKAVGGPYMTVNEFRATQNMPPVAGGDVLYAPANTAGKAGGGGFTGPNGSALTKEQTDAIGVLFRSGYTPQGIADALGIEMYEHTGLLPVTLKTEEAIEAEGATAADSVDETTDDEGSDE